MFVLKDGQFTSQLICSCRCPRRNYFIRMNFCVVSRQSISSSAHFLTNYTSVHKSKMNICMLLCPLFGLKQLSTMQTSILSIFISSHHLLDHSIEI